MNSEIIRLLLKFIVILVKVVLGLLLVLFFVVGVPLIIDWLYDFPEPLIYTEWGPSELLDYYGTLLGTAVTVLTFYFGIRNEFRKNRKETIKQRQIEVIDRLIGLCDELKRKALPGRFLLFHQISKAAVVKDKVWVFDLFQKAIPILDEAHSSINNFGTSLDALNIVGLDKETLSNYQAQMMVIHKETKKKHEELMSLYRGYADKDEEQREAEFPKLLETVNEYLKIFAKSQDNLVQIQRQAVACLLSFKNESIGK